MNTRPDVPAPIGAQIRELRTVRNMTLGDLAEEVGTSVPTMHRYEGLWEGFNLKTLRRIADALDSDLEVRLRPRDRAGTGDLSRQEASSSVLLEGIQELFWDVEITEEQVDEFPGWILSRVLNEGTLEHARMVITYYGRAGIEESLSRRDLSEKARAFLTAFLKERA